MSDWIKMRSSLLTNLKVVRMARDLLQDPDFIEWMCSGVCAVPRDAVTLRDERVTKRDFPVVTRIIVGALLAVWSAVNEMASRDGVIRHASSRDVDQTAGVPGFGKALVTVGWLEELPDGEGVRFVNFEEHNQPQKERTLTAKTGAERQKEYRERKRKQTQGVTTSDVTRDGDRNDNGDVTGDVTRDGLEEKKRGEKKNPSGSKRKTSKPAAANRCPKDFEVTADMQAWAAEKAPLVNWQRETETFRDYEFKRSYTDWPATWRMWLRNAQDRAEGKQPAARGASNDDWTRTAA